MPEKMKFLLVLGTRPEAIKMAPLFHALKRKGYHTELCATGQHREMLQQALQLFDIVPDYHLDIMQQQQTLADVSATILQRLTPILEAAAPDMVLVHGDTATTFAGALAAFYQKIPVGHVEAGLRSHNKYAPWPEEMNRTLTSCIAAMHFAPTQQAYDNLIAENIAPETITITGNTVIDALQSTVHKIKKAPSIHTSLEQQFNFLRSGSPLMLVTGHRRENFGDGFMEICTAIKTVAEKYPQLDIVYPVHLNPQVQIPVNSLLNNIPNVHLLPPLDYLPFVYLMHRCHFILTDSGGIQEEAPALGKPVLVMRDTTERPEAIEAGTAMLVGAKQSRIIAGICNLMNDEQEYNRMAQAHSPFGNGTAAEQIVNTIETCVMRRKKAAHA
jgi:UDP-N-acetylglucosamine 2-epimerase (non-hydrolysing)